MNGLVVLEWSGVNIMLMWSSAIIRDHSDRHLYNFVQLQAEKLVERNYDFYKSPMGVFKGPLLCCIMKPVNAVNTVSGIIKNQTKTENNQYH